MALESNSKTAATCQWHCGQRVKLQQPTRDGEVDVSASLAVVVLGALDDHQVGREVHAPGQRAGRDQHLKACQGSHSAHNHNN